MDTVISILRGLFGMAAFIGILYLLSDNKKAVSWRLVAGGLFLQLTVGLLVLKVDFVSMVFDKIAKGFANLLQFTSAGTDFLFAPFGSEHMDSALGNFVFIVLPTIVFFSALSSLLYYFGILQFITRGIAWVMSKTMKLTGAESLAAAANVFIGQTEAPLVVKPYLEGMSRSELNCLMTGGFATIAGSVFAAYMQFLGGDDLAAQAFYGKHLLTASIMAAPAGIVAAKIILPAGKEIPLDEQKLDVSRSETGTNVLDAVTRGSTDGFKLAVNVGIMLLVFTALIALFNSMLANGIGSWTGLNDYVASSTDGRFTEFNFQYILGVLFSPIAWLIGTEWKDTMLVGQLLGAKMTINEFYAYSQLPAIKELLSEKSILISTYALCGFANFASIGIQIGGISAIAPGQRKNLTQLALKAMLGGTIATFMTATIASMFL